MRRLIGYLRVLRARIRRALSAALRLSALSARITVINVAAFISVIGAVAAVIGAIETVRSARFARDQALSARMSTEAAIETLRRSEEDLRILVDVDYQAPVAVSLTVSDEYWSFRSDFAQLL